VGVDSLALAVEAEDLAAPRCRTDEPQQKPDGRRLAGAVGSEEADDLSLEDLEVEVIEGRDGPVALGEALRPDDRGDHWRLHLSRLRLYKRIDSYS